MPLDIEYLYIVPPEVDRVRGIWGSYYNVPEAIFYLLNGGYDLEQKGQHFSEA